MSITINLADTSTYVDLCDFKLDDTNRYYTQNKELIEDVRQLSDGDIIIQEIIDEEKENLLIHIEEKYYVPTDVSDRMRDDKDVVLAAVKNNCKCLEGPSDRGYMLNIGGFFQNASDRLKDDAEVILTVIQTKLGALHFASDRFKDDRELILTAIKQNGWVIHFASNRLKDDRELVLISSINGMNALQNFSDKIRDDKEIVLSFVTQYDYNLEYVSDRLKDDKEVVLAALITDPKSFQYASDRLKDDKEVVLAAINQYSRNLKFVSDRLKDDEDVIITAFDIGPSGLIRHASLRIQNELSPILKKPNCRICKRPREFNGCNYSQECIDFYNTLAEY